MIELRNYMEPSVIENAVLIRALKLAERKNPSTESRLYRRANRIGQTLRSQIVVKKKTLELELEGQGNDAQKSVSQDVIA